MQNILFLLYSILILTKLSIAQNDPSFLPSRKEYRRIQDSISNSEEKLYSYDKSSYDSVSRYLKIPIFGKFTSNEKINQKCPSITEFIVGNSIEIDNFNVLYQKGMIIDPRDVLYKLSFYIEFHDNLLEIEKHYNLRRAFLHIGIHSTYILGPPCIPYLVVSGVNRTLGIEEWNNLINKYNNLIKDGKAFQEKMEPLKRTYDNYRPKRRKYNAFNFSAGYSYSIIDPIKKSHDMKVDFQHIPGHNHITVELKNKLYTAYTINPYLEYGGYKLNDNYFGIRAYLPIYNRFKLDDMQYSVTDSLSIKYEEAASFTVGGYFIYKRRFHLHSNLLNFELIIGIGNTCMITEINKDKLINYDGQEVSGHNEMGTFISGGHIFRYINMNFGSTGLRLNFTKRKFNIYAEYLLGLGYNYLELYNTPDFKNYNSFLMSHSLSFGFTITDNNIK